MTTTLYDPAAGFAAWALQARTDAAGSAVDDTTGAEARLLIAAAYTAGIVRPAAGYQVRERQAGANMSVDVGSGTASADVAVVEGTDSGQGSYLVRLGDALTNLTIEAADLSNPRIDEIYLIVQDNAYDSSARVLPRLAVRKGTPASSPSAPGPDGAWKAYLLLASVAVAAGETSIQDADITDERVFSRPDFGEGGLMPTGAILEHVRPSAPTGFLPMDNVSTYTQADFARLWNLCGTPGSGVLIDVGGGNFKTPNWTGRITIQTGGTPGLAVAATSGSWDHTHTGPSHTHTGPSHTHTGPSHTHTGPSHTHAGPSHTHGWGTLSLSDHGNHKHPFSDSFTTGTGSTTTLATGTDISVSRSTHTHSGSVSGTTDEGSGAGIPGDPFVHSGGAGATAADGTGSTGAAGTGNTGASGTANTGAGGTGNTGASGTGATGGANPPVVAVYRAIKT